MREKRKAERESLRRHLVLIGYRLERPGEVHDGDVVVGPQSIPRVVGQRRQPGRIVTVGGQLDLLHLWLQSVECDLQHDFAWVTDEAYCSAVLALLQVAFLGKCDD